jgi:ABC-2 type transport system permease protein
MIGTIARKELTEMLRDDRLRWSASLVLILLIGALMMGWRHYRDVEEQHETARRATREHWLNQGTKNPHSAAHYGVYAFKPKQTLSLVDPGVDPYVGVAVWLEAHRQNEFVYRPAQDSTAIQRLGELTGATVLQVLIPLMIILFTFSSFAGEREQGILRHLLSLGIPPAKLAAGKALGVALALAALLVPAAILGAGVLALTSGAGVFFARVAGVSVTYLVYFAILTMIALAVSAWAPNSRIALVSLLAVWILNSLVMPKAASDFARRVHPTPSAFEFSQRVDSAIRNGIDGHDPQNKRMEELKQRLLNEHGVQRVEQLPVNFSGISLQAGEEYSNQVYDRYYGELWDQFRRQERLHALLGFVAPLLPTRSLSMGFAGTDFAQHVDFARAAEEYRRMVQRKLNNDIAYNPASRGSDRSFVYVRGRDLWEQIPDFTYHLPETGWIFRNHWLSVVMLGWWLVVAAYGLWIATRRLKAE